MGSCKHANQHKLQLSLVMFQFALRKSEAHRVRVKLSIFTDCDFLILNYFSGVAAARVLQV